MSSLVSNRPRSVRRFVSVWLLAGLSWSGLLSAAESAIAPAAGQPLELLGLRSTVPADWVLEEPQSSMRLAQLKVPADGGLEGAAMVVYYFGPSQGGTLEANVERWQSQFTGPDGDPVAPEITELNGALPAKLVVLRGNYARGVGVGPVGEALPNRMLLAAIVQTPQGNLYPQLHGPAAVVEQARPAFVAFVEGLAPANSATEPASAGE